MNLTNTKGQRLNLYLTLHHLDIMNIAKIFLHERQSELKRHDRPINKVIQTALRETCGLDLKHIHCWEYRKEALRYEDIGQVSCDREIVISIQTDQLILMHIDEESPCQQKVSFIKDLDEVKEEEHVVAIVPNILSEDFVNIYLNLNGYAALGMLPNGDEEKIFEDMKKIKVLIEVFKGKHSCSKEKSGQEQVQGILNFLASRDLGFIEEEVVEWVKQLCCYEKTYGTLDSYDIATCYQEASSDAEFVLQYDSESTTITPQVLQIIREIDKEAFPTLHSHLRWWLKSVSVQGGIKSEDFNPYEYDRLLKEQYMRGWGAIHKHIVQIIHSNDMQSFLECCSQVEDKIILKGIMEYVDDEVFPINTQVGILVRRMARSEKLETILTAQEEKKYKEEIEKEIAQRASDCYVVGSFSKKSAENICETLSQMSGNDNEIEKYLRCVNYYYKYVSPSLRYFSEFPMKTSELNETFELEEQVIQLLKSFKLKRKSRFISTYLSQVATEKKGKFVKNRQTVEVGELVFK